MRGPLLITALPEDLSGLEIELVLALHRLTLKLGRDNAKLHKLLVVKTPQPVSVLISTLPDHVRMSVSRVPGQMPYDDTALIFITADGHNYLLLETTIAVAELQAIVRDLDSVP